ncbi:MAG TPA: hypothetical protein VNK48_17625 [Xanthobacteraceae bacterium]|nr:hypothetical protein [Xanthobacteraceae bacterium]
MTAILAAAVATSVLIAAHATMCRLSVLPSIPAFLLAGVIAGGGLGFGLYGLGASLGDVVVAFLVFAFASELYLFAFTAVLGSISANILALAAAKPLSIRELGEIYNGATMAALRLERARSAGLVRSAAGNLELTPRGRLLAGVFSWLRDLFGHDAEP